MDSISKEWKEFKDELSKGLEEAKEESENTEILDLIAHMLKNTRIKVRSTED